MDTVIMLIAPLEMLLVNLFVIHQCSERKRSKTQTYLVLGIFTTLLMTAALLLANRAPGFGNGNGLFVFSGFLYVIPIMYLYKLPGVKIVTIACYSWAYTFLLFVLSARLSQIIIIPGWPDAAVVLIIQTALYALSLKAFYGMLQSKFIYVIEHLGKSEARAFMWMTMMWFWMAMILNLSFVYPDIWAFQILSFVSIVVSALSSFRYIYLQAISDETIQELEEIAFRDEITQLRSRAVLTRDVEDFISRQIPFHVVFCDLDNFKSVNDQYGHSVGDQYLTFFAYEIKLRLGNRGGFYRIAGDEFVCIFVDPDIKAFLDEIVALPAYLPNSNIKFLGFSHGVAYYPTDGDSIEQLLECADQRMYVMKRQQSATAPVGSSLIISHKNPKL